MCSRVCQYLFVALKTDIDFIICCLFDLSRDAKCAAVNIRSMKAVADRKSDRQTVRQIVRQTDRQTDSIRSSNTFLSSLFLLCFSDTTLLLSEDFYQLYQISAIKSPGREFCCVLWTTVRDYQQTQAKSSGERSQLRVCHNSSERSDTEAAPVKLK